MSRISIAKCGSYEIEQVRSAVYKALEPLGGIESFVKPGDKVLLKVNLLMKRKPELVTTTHPVLAQVMAELVKQAGGVPMIGDSPGGYYFYNQKVLDAVYETCGMKAAAANSGAELNYNTEMIDVPYHEGKIMKTVKTIKPVLEADKIINLPKIKTHMMTVYSGAVKNLFGIIPGGYKSEYHLRFDDARDFADLLVDICSFAKPALTVMDAVMGMEGYGPTAGNPKQVGLIIAGQSPYELDVVASHIIGLKPEQVPTIQKSADRGLCTMNIKDIDIVGEAVKEVLVPDFKKPTVKVAFNFYNVVLPKFITKKINRLIKPTPKFKHDICKGCRMCEKSCPPKVIAMKAGKPYIKDHSKCIRCFCCHELCDFHAVDIKRPWFVRLILR